MTSVNITTDINTVTVLDDGATIIVTTGSVSKDTFDALEALAVRSKTGTAPLQHQPGKPKLTRQGNGARSKPSHGRKLSARPG
jgi:hypothetical protein